MSAEGGMHISASIGQDHDNAKIFRGDTVKERGWRELGDKLKASTCLDQEPDGDPINVLDCRLKWGPFGIVQRINKRSMSQKCSNGFCMDSGDGRVQCRPTSAVSHLKVGTC
ncbi:hypothetical protein LTR65_002507 [Meristemomyces frigidus]